MDVSTDIDIDVADRTAAISRLPHVDAIESRGTERRRHACGIYLHDIPADPLDGMAVWDYETAEAKGFFKIDIITNHIYRDVRDESHLVDLLTTEPPWDLFDDKEIVDNLYHIRNHYPIVHSIQPTSIEDLAICLALIRPGKRHLVGKSRHIIDQEIWLPTDDYYYKKAHAISFAASIVVQLNLMIEKANDPILL